MFVRVAVRVCVACLCCSFLPSHFVAFQFSVRMEVAVRPHVLSSLRSAAARWKRAADARDVMQLRTVLSELLAVEATPQEFQKSGLGKSIRRDSLGDISAVDVHDTISAFRKQSRELCECEVDFDRLWQEICQFADCLGGVDIAKVALALAKQGFSCVGELAGAGDVCRNFQDVSVQSAVVVLVEKATNENKRKVARKVRRLLS